MKKTFTLVEITIVVSIIALIISATIAFLNPLTQIKKSWDGKRKAELNTLAKVFEDFYNDKNRFPSAQDVCFDAASSPRTDLYGKTACTCQICGRSPQSPSFSPYLSNLPCDPQSSSKEYLYDYDCSTASPNWFRIYTKLSLSDDPDIKRVGCGAGCGPSPDFAYNYLVFSNAQPEAILCSDYLRLYQKDEQGFCNICKSPIGGDVCDYDKNIYNEVTCTQKCGS